MQELKSKMSQIDADENILSETEAEHEDTGNSLKLVPVAESIRYRKRAQSAEKKIETLAEQLAQAKSQASEMAKELSSIRVEQKLTHKLAIAGVIDLETAVLIAKAKIGAETEADLDGVIEQLKKEKQYLFSGTGAAATAKKTAGAKDRMQNSQTILERAAKKAATTGNRTDLQEYLKLRRNFV
jgi:hypothetical protein